MCNTVIVVLILAVCKNERLLAHVRTYGMVYYVLVTWFCLWLQIRGGQLSVDEY